ncbi:4-alpha-glucanotransferase [Endozoicomonas sp. (ex Bugula neritina AB1)]|nr:4-alpha-glucanotransferase [Endozoicomonas sp. (ex Bugula neritina AB1)]
MINHELINQLGDSAGMSREYLDWAGKPVVVDPVNKIPLLQAMGFDTSSDKAIQAGIDEQTRNRWLQIIPNALVLHQNKPYEMVLRLPQSDAKGQLTLSIVLESGESSAFEAVLNELEPLEHGIIKGQELVALKVVLPKNLPLGYHTLMIAGIAEQCSLIVAPEVCFEPEPLEQGQKIWGSSVQLYSVRSKTNWGIGDYKDLEMLGRELGKNGADIVGLNPVHALYPANPLHCSPYSPSSRVFGNVLYINPEMVPEFTGCKKARKLVSSSDYQQRLNAVRDLDFVDYQESAALKLPVLEILFDHFKKKELKKNTKRAQTFKTFCQERGDSLRQYATFEALYEHFKQLDIMNWGWPCWPKVYQTPDTKEVKAFAAKHKDRLQYFEYLQWLAEEQIDIAQKAAKKASMMVGIYRDLAVGVDRGGADVWSDRRLYVLDASTGAPPDALGPKGQNWGLPPFNPVVLQEQGYEPFIELIRNSMNNCGALRMDHAMGLFRLWWCPNDKGAAYGAYVHYPLQDLLGIIKLESQRQQCLVFGEDLGTVPQEITDSLPPARFYSSVMGIFNQQGNEYLPAKEFKKKALATLVCHDTPTLRGWWQEIDIDLFTELGFFDEERAASERKAREPSRKAIINTLHKMGEHPEGVDPHAEFAPEYSREIMEKFSYYLAHSASQIVGVQLEDCMMIETPVNLPGTSEEYPNWRRRLTENLEDFFAKEENKEFFANLTGCRKS